MRFRTGKLWFPNTVPLYLHVDQHWTRMHCTAPTALSHQSRNKHGLLLPRRDILCRSRTSHHPALSRYNRKNHHSSNKHHQTGVTLSPEAVALSFCTIVLRAPVIDRTIPPIAISPQKV